jgi:Rieske Fe-S protein
MFTRREALSRFIRYLVCGGLLTIAWSFLKGGGEALRKVSFSRLPEADQVIHQDGVYLVGTGKGPAAFASRCPHLGCRVEHQPGSDRFRCPCHGSEFTMDGERVKGPAKTGMTALAIKKDEEGKKCCVELVLS